MGPVPACPVQTDERHRGSPSTSADQVSIQQSASVRHKKNPSVLKCRTPARIEPTALRSGVAFLLPVPTAKKTPASEPGGPVLAFAMTDSRITVVG
jgi:hypothetical protein